MQPLVWEAMQHGAIMNPLFIRGKTVMAKAEHSLLNGWNDMMGKASCNLHLEKVPAGWDVTSRER